MIKYAVSVDRITGEYIAEGEVMGICEDRDEADALAETLKAEYRGRKGIEISILEIKEEYLEEKGNWDSFTTCDTIAIYAVDELNDEQVTTERIIEVVSNYFGINVNDIKSGNKDPEVKKARSIVMYLCRNMTDKRSVDIGKEIGGRDHSTVIYCSKVIDGEMRNDEELKNTIELIKAKILEKAVGADK